jgi:RNA polymerase sigma-70 factor (ECF subfamily)
MDGASAGSRLAYCGESANNTGHASTARGVTLSRPLLDLDRCIVRLADGDRAAFTPAFEALWPRVRRLCLTLLKHEGDADDAAQQAMEKILTRAVDYDPCRPALPWALAIAAWECRTIARRKQRRREVGADALGTLAAADSLEDVVVKRELVAALGDVLPTLSDHDRAAIEAFWQEAPGAASPLERKRRQRALERLRAAFRRLYEP